MVYMVYILYFVSAAAVCDQTTKRKENGRMGGIDLFDGLQSQSVVISHFGFDHHI